MRTAWLYILSIAVVLGLILPCTVLAEHSSSTIVNVGLRKQLFVDDDIIEKMSNIRRELGQPSKVNDGGPVIKADKPWEDPNYFLLGSVFREKEKFRLWYRGAKMTICYAESADGLNWVKPNLGFVEYDGNKNNNIMTIAHPQVYCPFLDPSETDSSCKYKSAVSLGGTEHGCTTGLACSADGLHWRFCNDGKPVTGRACDTVNQLLWDPDARVYRLFTRTDFGVGGGANEKRGTRDMVNADLKTDPTAWEIVRQWQFDREGASEYKRRQIYSLNCWLYEGVQFGLLWSIDWPCDLSEGPYDLKKRHERDVMNFYLVTARGSRMWDLHWVYADRPLIPRGPSGSFDKDCIQPAPNIVTWQDKHWIYYVGCKERHGMFDSGRSGAIGLATLRLDGFVCLEAKNGLGVVETKPFRLEGGQLELNVDATHGEVLTEILDDSGKPIPGFTRSDAKPIMRANELRLKPQWQGNTNVASLTGRIVRLRFHLDGAKLYAFQITAGDRDTRDQ